ncbi:hypothetical protein BCL57_000975 [Agromyces flavus]|uniref:Uncharacterized protein n=1 Tax=Agromyces flavus TaxID=589382 RepID=A0A1H1YWD9_9MICO|nr:hypothetical protein [Agromyces flavus]MCP2366833.1 hypothetical protein [Agromyces flavus]GGI45464.1 hypothetical protein GCM10010932_09770 [Agromyces flavus]SDT25750.1 hypothetical protein SAMN04489721_2911 [Agromyces flavus]
MSRNPYQLGLVIVGGVLLLLGFMLVIVVVELTDYAPYDEVQVATLRGSILLLVGIATTMITGSAVIGGAAWALRHSSGQAGSSDGPHGADADSLASEMARDT